MNDQFRQAVALIAAAFPVPSWELETLKLYADSVADLPVVALKAAALEWIKTQPERPSIAELRTAATNMANRMRRDAKRQRQIAAQPPAELELADPVAVRQLLSDVRKRLEAKSLPALRIQR